LEIVNGIVGASHDMSVSLSSLHSAQLPDERIVD